jgi:putative SOS response-associated peptidase YedK
MCGRFILTDLSVILERFAVGESVLPALPAGDFLPGQAVPVIIQAGRNRRLGTLRWGLVPAWAKDPAVGSRMFNARAETLAEKPSFKEAFQKRRCLIPAEGFYDWTGEKLHTCTIVTTEPNALIAPLHDRMPVILSRAGEAIWLDPAVREPALRPLLVPYPAEEMVMEAAGEGVFRAPSGAGTAPATRLSP